VFTVSMFSVAVYYLTSVQDASAILLDPAAGRRTVTHC